MEGARAHFHVVGLQDHAALLAPELLQRQDHVLERLRRPQAGSGIIGRGLGGLFLHALKRARLVVAARTIRTGSDASSAIAPTIRRIAVFYCYARKGRGAS